MTIAFLGLGNMGSPIAKNLIESGFDVQLYNRSANKLKSFEESRATITHDPREATANADVVISMLSDDQAVTEISSLIFPAMKAKSIHLSMSTISPETAKKMEDIHRSFDVSYLSSPVMGRPAAAQARQLFVLLSGASEAKEKVKSILEAIGQRTFDFGEDVSSAPTVKIMMNFMIFGITEMLSEVMLLAEKSSIDKNQLLDTMTNTIFGAPVVKLYGSMIAAEKDNPNGFATKLASKDLRLFQETSAARELRLPLADLVQMHFQEIIRNGGGQQDVSMLVSHLRNVLQAP